MEQRRSRVINTTNQHGDESEVTSVEEMSDDAESLDSLDIDPAGAPPPGGEGEPAPLDTPDLSHLLDAGLDDD